MANGSTVTQDVYRRLRADLLTCRLAPGEKLRIDALCERLQAGSSAVREALSRLAAENFVVTEHLRGFRVAPILFDELQDLTRVRCQIEEACIREAIKHGDVEWEAGVMTTLHRLSKLPMRAEGDPDRYGDAFSLAHTAFHAAVVSACSRPWLLKTREYLYSQHDRYRWLSMPLATVERDVHGEHTRIANAALARDADEAAQAMTDHLKLTAQIILSAAGVAEDGSPATEQGYPRVQDQPLGPF